MLLFSTRDNSRAADALDAVIMGISPDGGLFVPREFPRLTRAELDAMAKMPYSGVAARVLSKFIDEITPAAMENLTAEAYAGFDHPDVAPLHKLDGEHVLELWHGPTIAFKDMALQVLPRLLAAAKSAKGITSRTLILVATSGDTGKAALEGFANVPGTEIVVFYPDEGVSDMQKLQMVTQEGANTHVCAVTGNFDDAQTGVKRIFGDRAFGQRLAGRGITLSSANSINFGRLAPQVAYYVNAYVRLAAKGDIAMGDRINFVVPTGNFGNILAAYYAMKMGLPVNKLICASNVNNVLTDFFASGRYDRLRPFHKTMSPSMDIIISSNLERLLYEACGQDDGAVRSLMSSLSEGGEYTVDASMLSSLKEVFEGGYAGEERTATAIRTTYHNHGYLIDPHTAVAQAVYEDYRERTGDDTPTVVVSTASPYKFCPDVLRALGEPAAGDAFAMTERLSALTGTAIPGSVTALRTKPVRHAGRVGQDGMAAAVEKFVEE